MGLGAEKLAMNPEFKARNAWDEKMRLRARRQRKTLLGDVRALHMLHAPGLGVAG